MIIKESAENYLEAILVIKKNKGYVRSIDIAHELNITKPSVSVAMKHFREEEYITIDKDGYISLTDIGLEIGVKIYERHTILSKLLIHLGVDEETAKADACKLEHAISDKSFEAIKNNLYKFN